MRALIISVGTGTSLSEEAIDSLANAIAFSVQSNHPDEVFFVTSKESTKTTLSRVLEKIGIPNYETIQIKNPDDIQLIYEELREKFLEIRTQFRSLCVDYTSGTKAMTGALVILGSLYDADTLSYISGKRIGGVVVKGTEKLQVVQPYFATCERRIGNAIKFFNECQFETTLAIVHEIKNITADAQILERIQDAEKATIAYSAWDRFDHDGAFRHLSTLRRSEFDRNKRFLGRLLNLKNPEPKEPYFIADILNNAARRGDIEKKYDDAVARLYRAIELIAQYQLSSEYGIDTSNVRVQDVPEELRREWHITQVSEKNIRIGLDKAYKLLLAKGDQVAERYSKDEELRNLLSKRNASVLAHGLSHISRDIYGDLCKKAYSYASMIIHDLDSLLEDSKFIQL